MDLKKRLNSMVSKDKKTNPKCLEDVIKSDFYYLINNYFEIDFDDIEVEIKSENNQYSISISSVGDRIKIIRLLP